MATVEPFRYYFRESPYIYRTQLRSEEVMRWRAVFL